MLLLTGVGGVGGGACLGVSKAALKKLNLKVAVCVFTSLEERMFGSCLEGLSCSKTAERLVKYAWAAARSKHTLRWRAPFAEGHPSLEGILPCGITSRLCHSRDLNGGDMVK